MFEVVGLSPSEAFWIGSMIGAGLTAFAFTYRRLVNWTIATAREINTNKEPFK